MRDGRRPEKAGVKERAAWRLKRIVAVDARSTARGTGALATIGATATFVGLLGTVWGIMNAFVGISRRAGTTNFGRGGAGPSRCGAASRRQMPSRRRSSRLLRPAHCVHPRCPLSKANRPDSVL